MSSLAELQASFAAALVDPARPAPSDIRHQVQLARRRRFDVHRNNMTVSLIEVLEAGFPVVRRLVGHDFFRAAARTYLRLRLPGSPVVLLYGESFGDFLETFEPARGVPYLGDMARLEWARLNAYHAADAEPLPVTCLARVPQDRLPDLCFDLHPALQLLVSRWPVASLWAVTGGSEPDREVDMTRGEAVAVIRPSLTVELRVLPPDGHAFIAALAEGLALGAAARVALARYPDFDLSSHLQGLFSLGTVIALSLPNPDSQQT